MLPLFINTLIPTLDTSLSNSNTSLKRDTSLKPLTEMLMKPENRSGRFPRSSELNERVATNLQTQPPRAPSWVHADNLSGSLPPYAYKIPYTWVNGEWTMAAPGYDSPENFLASAPSNPQIANSSPYKNPKQESVALLTAAQQEIARDFDAEVERLAASSNSQIAGDSPFKNLRLTKVQQQILRYLLRDLWKEVTQMSPKKVEFVMLALKFHERLLKAERDIDQAFHLELGKTLRIGEENRWMHAHPAQPTNLAEQQQDWAHRLYDAQSTVSDALRQTNRDFLQGPFAAQIRAAKARLDEPSVPTTQPIAPQPPVVTPPPVQTVEESPKMFEPEPWAGLPSYPKPFTNHDRSRTNKNSLKKEFEKSGYSSGENFLTSKIGNLTDANKSGRLNPAQEAVELLGHPIKQIEAFINQRFEYHQKKISETRNPAEKQYWVDHFRTEMEQNMAGWERFIPKRERDILQAFIKEFIKAGEGPWNRWFPKPTDVSSIDIPVRDTTIRLPLLGDFTFRGLRIETGDAPNWRYSGDKTRWRREWTERDHAVTSPHGRRQEAIGKVHEALRTTGAPALARLREKVADGIRRLRQLAST